MPPRAEPPKDLEANTAGRCLVVTWDAGHVGRYPYTSLRGDCHCASCVDEWTGVRRIDPASIPPDIVIRNMRLVGNYALGIEWSDGHTTGIYTWERLRELCPCPQCRGAKS
jgi:DUF971 family protein